MLDGVLVVEVDECGDGLFIVFYALLHPPVHLDQFFVLAVQFHGHDLVGFGAVVAVLSQPFDVDDLPLLDLLLLDVSHPHLPPERDFPHPVAREVFAELVDELVEFFETAVECLLCDSLQLDHFLELEGFNTLSVDEFVHVDL